jgi:hypothetical protein
MAVPQCPGAHCSAISEQINNICKADGFSGNVVYVVHNDQYCYCNCSCVAVDTLVAVGKDSWKRMGDLRVGDSILAMDTTGKWTAKKIKFSNGTGAGDGNPVPYAIFVALKNGTQLIVTADHPFLLSTKKLQVACRLSPSDELLDENMQPLEIATIGYGEYVGGIHNVSTSTGKPGEPLDGHLINTGGIISGDFYAQLYLVEEPQLKMPMVGMPEYFARHRITPELLGQQLEDVTPPDPRFVHHRPFVAPAHSVGFLPPWMEQTDPSNLRPLDDTLPLEMAEYLLTHFRKSYPSINYHVRWTDNAVNAYAWIEGGQRHVAILGGLIRHKAVEIEGLGLVIAHEIGHHYGGPPRYPNNPWASCEGQADYWGALVAMREVWWGEEALEQISKGAEQLYNLFAFGLLSSLSEAEAQERLAAMAGCAHPPAACRRDTYRATLSLKPKPACAS